MSDLTPEALAELQRLLDECQPGRVIVNDLRPTHHAIWLDSRYDSGEWESLRTLAEIDTETETLEVLWGLNDAVLIAAALNALPDLLNAAEPIVRTVGDLTARHIGRRVRVEGCEYTLDHIGPSKCLFILGPGGYFPGQQFPLDTPCEVLS